MTFKTFEGIVKEHRPEIEVAPHGQYLGVVNSVSVAVIFNPPYGKVYHYNGTYCDVLNRLGIKACYRSQLNTFQENLKRLKTKHGKLSVFGYLIDNTEEIQRYEEIIARIEREFIIIEA